MSTQLFRVIINHEERNEGIIYCNLQNTEGERRQMRMGGRNRFSIKERDRERERVRSGRIAKKEREGSKYLTRCKLEVSTRS